MSFVRRNESASTRSDIKLFLHDPRHIVLLSFSDRPQTKAPLGPTTSTKHTLPCRRFRCHTNGGLTLGISLRPSHPMLPPLPSFFSVGFERMFWLARLSYRPLTSGRGPGDHLAVREASCRGPVNHHRQSIVVTVTRSSRGGNRAGRVGGMRGEGEKLMDP